MVNAGVFHLVLGSIGAFIHYLSCHGENIIATPNKKKKVEAQLGKEIL